MLGTLRTHARTFHRHCEPTGPAKGRPEDRLREAIQGNVTWPVTRLWIASSLRASQ
jgi:hypothetical protein